MGEFDLIRRYLHGLGRARQDVVLGPGDDAAVICVDGGTELVMSMDTLLAGRHFPEDLPPFDVGFRALAVNLSDLAAMGAAPAWALLSLSLPMADETWLAGFTAGLGELAQTTGLGVVGGDLVRGPLAVTLQVTGLTGGRGFLTRRGAAPGDEVWISGTLGGAGAALATDLEGLATRDPRLYARFARPQPRLDLGRSLLGIATAAIDVSDGLAADLGHLLAASDVGARLDVERLPVQPDAVRLFGERQAREFAVSAGDDYELCFTVPPGREEDLRAAAGDVAVTRVGHVVSDPGLNFELDGARWQPDTIGWNHFEDPP
jgi:thiamine-monophosphate kinase